MIQPTQVIEAFKKHTSSLLIPSASATSVAPMPTVVPNKPHYETVGETGTKTLWVRLILELVPPAQLTFYRSSGFSCFSQL
jgi:hypothetical protein